MTCLSRNYSPRLPIITNCFVNCFVKKMFSNHLNWMLYSLRNLTSNFCTHCFISLKRLNPSLEKTNLTISKNRLCFLYLKSINPSLRNRGQRIVSTQSIRSHIQSKSLPIIFRWFCGSSWLT